MALDQSEAVPIIIISQAHITDAQHTTWILSFGSAPQERPWLAAVQACANAVCFADVHNTPTLYRVLAR